MSSGRTSCPTLVSYVTSHGFGHLNRSVAVLNQIPADIRLVIRCHPNLYDHWKERLKRPAEFEAHVSDAGAINPPGNSADTDPLATLQAAQRVFEQTIGTIDEEADRLRSLGATAVLADVPPLPLAAARRAGLHALLLANFTWADIYAPYVKRLGASWSPLLRELRTLYRNADLLFRARPGLPMNNITDQVIDVGMVVTAGKDRGTELRQFLGLPADRRLIYMYLGRYGQTSLEWERIGRMASEGLHFVGFHPAPEGVEPPPNLHVVPAEHWTGADLAASCNVVVAKAGYGTVCEAMVAGKPMIYPPRTNFAEHRALAWALNAWGGGLPASRRAFDRLRIEPLIRRALSLQPGPLPFSADGASRVASAVSSIARGTRPVDLIERLSA